MELKISVRVCVWLQNPRINMLIKGQLCPLNSHCRITCEIGTSSDDMSYSTYICGMKKTRDRCWQSPKWWFNLWSCRGKQWLINPYLIKFKNNNGVYVVGLVQVFDVLPNGPELKSQGIYVCEFSPSPSWLWAKRKKLKHNPWRFSCFSVFIFN